MLSRSVKKESGSILSSEGLPIRYDVYIPHPAREMISPVIFLHGFKGFKDWGPFPDACYEIASEGFVVIAINLSLNGVGESLTEFDEPELFRRQTLTQDLNDVGSVINAIRLGEIETGDTFPDVENTGIIGHSRGGHTAIAAAAKFSEISTVITWSAVADYNKFFSDTMKEDWDKNGVTEIINARTGQKLLLDKTAFSDAQENADELIAVNKVKNLQIPCCFIHGSHDEAVPVSHVEMLFNKCPSRDKEKIIIQGAGHTFGTSHPFDAHAFPPHFEKVVRESIKWLEAYLT